MKVTSEMKLKSLKTIYGVSSWKINVLNNMYPVAYIPVMIVSTLLFNTYDLKVGIVIAAVMQGIGAATKALVDIHFD